MLMACISNIIAASARRLREFLPILLLWGYSGFKFVANFRPFAEFDGALITIR
jgi:hypothetical protein